MTGGETTPNAAPSPALGSGGIPLVSEPRAAARSKRLVFFRRLLSAVILWSLLLGVLVAGNPVGYFLLTTTVGLLGLWEFYGMLDHKGLPNFKLFGMTCAAIFFAGSYYFLAYRDGSAHSNNFEMAVLLIFLLGVFGRQLFTRAAEQIPPLETMAYTVFGLLYVPWLFNFIIKIIYLVPHSAPNLLTGQYYVLYLIAVAKFSDMGAYLTGSVIGRHKMVPHISPGKTWEGFGGAVAFSWLASFGLHALLPQKLNLLGTLDLFVLGLVLGVAAVIGDLAESVLKRGTGVKDSGRTLPGIGGVLDLIDSLLFTAPLLFFYLRFLLGPA
jgi:phosphatidate cytidylyltransferase